jgi:sugar-phosphatase
VEYQLHGIVQIPGALALLNSIPRGRWAVVTSGTRFLAVNRMQKFGVPVPDIMVTAADVSNGKPDPEPYRRGAELLETDPTQCVVFEDAPAGIRSAHGAGMKVISLPSTYPVSELHEADAIVGGLSDVTVTVNGAAGREKMTLSLG